MKIHPLIKPTLFIAATLTFTAAVSAEDVQAVKYSFTGNRLAKTVCRSIVYDQVRKLDRTLRNEQSRTHSLRMIDSKVRCNDKNLYVFAREVNAAKIQDYLLRLDRFRGIYQAIDGDRDIASR